jgi:carbamoyl-phosphate synthase large subunit
MKSVGEVMAIGRTFQESFQKALRGLETGASGLDEVIAEGTELEEVRTLLRRELQEPSDRRIWYVAEAFRHGWSLEEVFALTWIDRWWLVQIEDLVRTEQALRGASLRALTGERLLELKRKGFSDHRLATLLGATESDVRGYRHEHGVRPAYKRVDTCAAEFATATAYMYSTYEAECESEPTARDKIMVLGGGPNRIGQGIEFDYCCVHAALALRDDGYETIMVNCNPETVSTDFDTSDRLYFEPLTLEDTLEILHTERPAGVIVQFGGQTPLKLARALEAAGAPIIGTAPDAIDMAEDRDRFQQLIGKLDLRQPPNRTARDPEEARALAAHIGYPLMVRPSYVLGGRAMEIVHSDEDLVRYMREAVLVSNESPVLLDRFLNDALEVDVDAVSDGTDVFIGGIMEHIEQAGVHSGDSACSLPPYTLDEATQQRLRDQMRALARELHVVGLMNTQFAIQGDEIYVLEVNPRASRTVPFVSKATGVPLAKISARCMVGRSLADQGVTGSVTPPYYSVKESVFPFIKFAGVDPLLGPEMKSTGEVMGVGRSFGEAFAKSQMAAGDPLPRSGKAFISVRDPDKAAATEIARALAEAGFEIVATHGTAGAVEAAGIPCKHINKVKEGRPHIVDLIKNDEIALIINTTEGKSAIADSYTIRREALNHKVAYTTTIAGGRAMCLALAYPEDGEVNRLQQLHQEIV